MDVDFCRPVRLGHETRETPPPWLSEQTDEGPVVFKISAFREEFYLSLTPDSSFLASGGFSPEGGTAASSASQSTDLRTCFYSGDVNADADSIAALSLCKGLHGGFYYNGVEYFISQTWAANRASASGRGNPFNRTHMIRRRTHRPTAHSDGNFTSRCGVTPDTSFYVSLGKYNKMSKMKTGGLTEAVLKTMGRSKRFASIPRFVEVLVVADDSMASFHGDDLKHYLLTLMSVAARLYKHPSILNSINIVVVGFVVINASDNGPRVSSNAALTLRNFCSWQKKLNKDSDRHPEYWDTAILFTKQVMFSTCPTTM